LFFYVSTRTQVTTAEEGSGEAEKETKGRMRNSSSGSSSNADDASAGDDDSFEDVDGKPRFHFLWQYVSPKICGGRYVTNENGVEIQRTTATIQELATFYCTHRALIREKRARYKHYNRRIYKSHEKNFIAARGNKEIYATHFKKQLAAQIERYYATLPAHLEGGTSSSSSSSSSEEEEKSRKSKKRTKQTKRVNPTKASSSTKRKRAMVEREDAVPMVIPKDRVQYIQRAIRTKTLRLEHVENEKELCDYFTHHLKGQDKSLRVISHEIFMIKSCDAYDTEASRHKSGRAMITSILASGISGTGKSELITLIQPLFHMEPGGLNERCFVELRFGNITNVSHCSAITGPGPGYKDTEQPCLVDLLIAASDFILAKQKRAKQFQLQQQQQQQEEEEEEEEEEDGAERRKRSSDLCNSSSNSNRTPNVILVFIDELCKANADVGILNTFNSLLSAGVLQRGSGNITFRLPSGVTLFFYSTANFGADAILEERVGRQYQLARTLIIDDMREHGVKECDLARLGDIVPFFPLSMSEAAAIMRLSVDNYFERMAEQVSRNARFEMASEDRVRLVAFYLEGSYMREQGVRQLCSKIEKELSHHVMRLAHKAKMTTASASGSSNGRRERATLQFIVIKYGDYVAASDGLLIDYPDMTLALSDETNSENLNDAQEAKADIGYFKLLTATGRTFINIVLSQIATPLHSSSPLGGSGGSSSSSSRRNGYPQETDRMIDLLRVDNEVMLRREHQVLTLLADTESSPQAINESIRRLYHVNTTTPTTTTTSSTTTTSEMEEEEEEEDEQEEAETSTSSTEKEKSGNSSSRKRRKTSRTDERNDSMRMVKCAGPCGATRPLYKFIKHYNRTIGGEKRAYTTQCSMCGDCRRRSQREKT
jgi:hypothetical protein